MMRIVAIIQARMGSTRLPGKALEKIAGMTMLERVVRRTAASRLISEVTVATTVSPHDDVISDASSGIGCRCFRGSEQDVLDRYLRAAVEFEAEIVVRITSDCPLIDAVVVDRVIAAFLDEAPDYASNTLERTYPRGLDTEVLSRAALDRAWREADQPYQREHVTPFIWQQPSLFRLLSVTDSEDHSCHRWTVDTIDDLQFVRSIYERWPNREEPGWRDVLHMVDSDPDLASINAHVAQKTIGQ